MPTSNCFKTPIVGTFASSNRNAAYGYNDTAHGSGIGRLTTMSDPSGSTNWTYDLYGHVTKKIQGIGAVALTTSYRYDGPTGHLLSMTLPSTKVIGYTWTSGQITALTASGSTLVSSIVYQPFSGPKSWLLANGETDTRTYDLDGRITSDPIETIGYDTASRITALTLGNHSAIVGSQTYGYDELDRVTAYTGPGGPIAYAYDANGNRSSKTVNGTATTYTISPTSNRFTQTNTGASHPAYGYDANGSRTSQSSNTYGYDTTGRLATYTSSNRSAAYGYNGIGARVQKTVNGIATLFAYDEAGHLIGEYSGTGSPIQETIYLGDLPVSMLRAAKLYAVHADYRNAPRQLDDATGTAVWTWTPLPFGESAAIANPIPYNLRYPGQYFDSESGLFYNGFRDYDPVAGQYIESDPIGLGGGVNTYAFTESNPINGTDPLGLTIFYANHPVAGDIYHSKIVIIPDEQAAYVNDPRFKVNEQGQYSATIGAGPEGFPWRLIAGVDRKRDVSQPCDNATPLHLPPVYRDENDAIKNLFDLANDYNRNPELYGLFPTNKGSYYNSNSFVSGLLNAAGFDPPMNTGAYTPGYNKPVPGYRY